MPNRCSAFFTSVIWLARLYKHNDKGSKVRVTYYWLIRESSTTPNRCSPFLTTVVWLTRLYKHNDKGSKVRLCLVSRFLKLHFVKCGILLYLGSFS